MDLLTYSAAFCLTFSLMFTHCDSHQVHLEKSLEHVDHDKFSTTLSSLPRKLKLSEEAPLTVKSFAVLSHKKYLMEASLDKKLHEKEENVMHGAEKGTWREWINGSPNKSEYFTMDYDWVRRRRPIHNKQIPFLP